MKNSNFKISHLSFSLIFTILLFVIYNAINIDKITKWFVLSNGIDYAGLIAFLIFGLCFFIAFFILLAHRWSIKPIAIIIIILSASSVYFIAKYNIAIEGTMIMNLLNTDTTEVTGLLSLWMFPYLFFLIFLPIFLVLKVKITFERPIKYLLKSFLIFVFALIFGLGMAYLEFKSIHRAGNQSKKYIGYHLVPSNFILGIGAIAQESIEKIYKKYKNPIKISGKVVSVEDLVVILAIGESSRQKNFSLYGYNKNTNPILSKKQGLHMLNGIARLGSTVYAIPEILEKEGIQLPAITNKLGIDTSCLVNYTLYDSCNAVGEVEVKSKNCGHNGHCYDEDVVPLLKDNLKSYIKGSKLVVLHLGAGSHGPSYKDRYPKDFQKFNPQCLDADVVNQCTIKQLYNSYDNTILYVDFVLGKILDTLDTSKVPYVFIYLSDHGESLLEEGRIFHGMPPGIDLPPEQAQIPLIVKSSIPITVIKRAEYKQQDIFDTILGLFSIETKILNKDRIFIKKIKNKK
jgi:lipid A ethanolaminephosphotransferase